MAPSGIGSGFSRRIAANSSILVAGGLVSAVLALGTFALAARGLGAEHFGLLVLVTTYVAVVDQLVNFHSWQALIKFGSEALSKRQNEALSALFSFGFVLDFLTAATGAAIAFAGAWVIGIWFGWDPDLVVAASIFSLTILFRLTGSPTAALRLFDCFKTLAWHTVLVALFKFIAVCAAFLFGLGIVGFLAIFAIADILGCLLLIYLAKRQLKREEIDVHIFPFKWDSAKQFPGIWSIVWTVNLSDTIRVATREIDVLIVGAFLGPVSVANYKIAKQVADVPMKLANPVQQVIYPYLAKLWAEGQLSAFYKLSRRIGIATGLVGIASLILAILLGEAAISLVFGAEYSNAGLALNLLMLAHCFFYFGIHLRPQALIFGAHKRILKVYVVSTIIFYMGYIPLLSTFGIAGAAASHTLFFLAWYLQMLWITRRSGSGPGTYPL